MSVMRLDLRPYTPQVSLQERDRRWQAVRKEMEARDSTVWWSGGTPSPRGWE